MNFKALRWSVVASLVLVACGGSQPAPQQPAADLKVAKGGSDAPQAAPATSSEDDLPLPIRATDATWGDRLAPVTIVEFEDFQCPFCSRAEKTLDAIKQEYGPEKLRIVWKNNPLPFHPNARPAAEWAMGVLAIGGPQAFWKFHDAAFAEQQSLGDAKYAEWTKLLGIEPASVQRGVQSHTWSQKIDDDMALAKKVGAMGTPAFFINGVSVVGAQPAEKFEDVIDTELHKAFAKIESGTPRDQIYAAMTAENLKNPPAPEPDEEEKPDLATYKVPVGKSPVKGNANALVTVVEFADFQCPYCSRADATIAQVLSTYGNDVRLVWKNEPLPFHKNAEPAAELALEARAEKGDAGFWAAHDKLFASQASLEAKDLERIAGELKLDVAKTKAAIKSHKYKAIIDADSDLGDDVQAAGTPHFFINGKRLVGAQPFDEFKSKIDAELANAKALVAKGTPAASVYETIIKDGKGAPTPERKTVADLTSSPMRGKATAKVELVEFADFQCPFCKRAEDDAVAQVRKDYGDKVKIVWRDLPLPFHQNAEPAAEAAREALAQKGATGFWKMHDLLFANQTKLDRADLESYAKQLGMDVAKLDAALDQHTHKAEIDADAKAAEAAGINGTPAFLVNGYFISGAQPYTKFKKLIERSLSEANQPQKP